MQNTLVTRSLSALAGPQDNIYETVAIISKRAKQINLKMKEELDQKLEEFASCHVEDVAIEDSQRQIELTRSYEIRPSPSIVATEEYLRDELTYVTSEVMP